MGFRPLWKWLKGIGAMAAPRHVYVFTYDISRDSRRARVADILSTSLIRVQRSVFEGRLTVAGARRLVRQVAPLLSAEDSLRAYAVTQSGRSATIVVGNPPLAEETDFLLL